MSQAQAISPLDAALELQRRGRPLPPKALSLIQAQQPQPDPDVEEFLHPTGVKAGEHLYGGQRIIAPTVGPADQFGGERRQANTIQALKAENPAFGKLAWGEQVDRANAALTGADESPISQPMYGRGDLSRYANSQGSMADQAQFAVSRLQSDREGKINFAYTDQQRESDRGVLRQYMAQRRQGIAQAAAESLPPGAAFATGAIGAASLGAYGVTQGLTTPEFSDVQRSLQSEHPVQTLTGGLVGSLIPGAAGFGFGQGVGTAIAGSSRLLGRELGQGFGQTIGRAVGGLVGGTAPFVPGAAGETLAHGGSFQQSLEAAGSAAIGGMDEIVHGLSTGTLTPEQGRQLIMNAVMLAGAGHEVAKGLPKAGAPAVSPLDMALERGDYQGAMAPPEIEALRQMQQPGQAEAPPTTDTTPPHEVQPDFRAGGAENLPPAPLEPKQLEARPKAMGEPKVVKPPMGEGAPPAPPAQETFTADQVMEHLKQTEPGTGELLGEQVRKHERYVRRDVPIDQIDLGITTDEAGQPLPGQVNKGKFIKARAKAAETAPEVVLTSENGQLTRQDGLHRILAAKARGEETVKAFVPEDYAPKPIEAASSEQFVNKDTRPQTPVSELQPSMQRAGVPLDEKAVERWMGIPPEKWPPVQFERDANGNRIVGDGNHRIEAAKRLGLESVHTEEVGRGREGRSLKKALDLENAAKERQAVGPEKGKEDRFRHEVELLQSEAAKARLRHEEQYGARNVPPPEDLGSPKKRSYIKEPLYESLTREQMDRSIDVGVHAVKHKLKNDFPVEDPRAWDSPESHKEFMRLKRDHEVVDEQPSVPSLAEHEKSPRTLEQIAAGDAEVVRREKELRGEAGSPAPKKQTIKEKLAARKAERGGQATKAALDAAVSEKRTHSSDTPAAESPPLGAKKVSPPAARAASARAGSSFAAPDSPHAMIRDLNRELGLGSVGVGGSHSFRNRTAGFFRVAPEAIRLKMADWLDVHAHEVGHYLHKLIFQGGVTDTRLNAAGQRISKTGLNPGSLPPAWATELHDAGVNLYGSKKPNGGYVSEGWAELIRQAFTDPTEAARNFPKAYPEAMLKLQTEQPAAYQALESFRTRYEQYRKFTPVAQAHSYIRDVIKRIPGQGKAGDYARDFLDRATTTLFDWTNPLAVLKRDLGLSKIREDLDPELGAKRAMGMSTGDWKRAVYFGLFDPTTGERIPSSKPLGPIIGAVRQSLDEFSLYTALQRAQEKRGQGYRGIFGRMSDAQIGQAIADLEKSHPLFKQAEGEFQKFNQWYVKDYSVAHGMLTPEAADRIVSKNLHYITFSELVMDPRMDGSAASKRGTGQGFVDRRPGFRHLPRDLQGFELEDPLAAFLGHMQRGMMSAQHNRVGQLLVDLHNKFEGTGRWFDSIDQPTEALRVQGEQIRTALARRLKDAGIDPKDPVVSDLLNLMTQDDFTTFKPGMRVDEASRQFMVYRKGKPTFWEAKNDHLFSLLKGMNSPTPLNLLLRALTIPRTVYRAAATSANPEFFVSNFMRDFAQAMVMSEGKGFDPGRSGARFKGMWKAMTTGDPGEMFLAGGADMSGLFHEYMDPKTKRFDPDKVFIRPDASMVFRGHVSDAQYAKAFKDLVTLGPIRRLNERFELMNRLGEFEAVIHQRTKGGKPTKADILAAGQAAADVTLDFSGGGTLPRSLNRWFPFFNAAFLGSNKAFRFFAKDPVRAFSKTVEWVMIPSAVSFAMNKDDPDYFNIPLLERDRYFHFPLGPNPRTGRKEWLKIPKPHALGVFGMLTERAMAKYFGIDPVTGKRGDPAAFDKLAPSIWQQFQPPMTVAFITPAIELALNYSMHFQGPIVRPHEKGPDYLQGAERSSEFARAMGRLMDVAPPRIDYAIQGFTAGVGKNLRDVVVDPIMRALPGKHQPLAKDPLSPENVAILRRFMTVEPRGYSHTMNQFWGQFDEAEQVYEGIKQLERDPKEQDEYEAKNAPMIEMYQSMLPFKQGMEGIYKEIRDTTLDGEIPDRLRWRKVDDLFRELNAAAAEGLREIRSHKEAP